MSNEFYPHKSFTNYRIQANNLDIMRQRIYANISDLNKYKHQLNANDYGQLMNHHYYILTTLDNIKTINYVESVDPYMRNTQVKYTPRGKAVLVDPNRQPSAEWERMFDRKIITPACNVQTLPPPSNIR